MSGLALGQVADQLYQLRQDRLALQKQVDSLQKKETELKNYIIETLPKSQASGVAGQCARVAISRKEVPQVKDREAFRAYIESTGRYDLATALRPSESAVRDMWDEGEEVPGLGRFIVLSVSCTKI